MASDVAKLVAEAAAATAECTVALNEQFLALIADDTSRTTEIELKIVAAVEKRKRAMATLLEHIQAHGW
jgi:hypothetical protein